MYSNLYTFSKNIWYIDSIFGIGLQRELKGNYSKVIKHINGFPNIISLDMATGIFSDSGAGLSKNINAHFTLSMGYPKIGHYFNSGLESTGDLFILDINLQPLKNTEYHIAQIELKDVSKRAPTHTKNIHKYYYQ